MMTYYLGGYCIRGRYCGLGETPLNGKQDIEHLQNLKCHDYSIKSILDFFWITIIRTRYSGYHWKWQKISKIKSGKLTEISGIQKKISEVQKRT